MNIPTNEGYTSKDAREPAPKKPESFIPAGKTSIRSNVGFIIIASERNRTGEEIVLGYNPEANWYVTWLCLGGYDYNHGHYGSDFFQGSRRFQKEISKMKESKKRLYIWIPLKLFADVQYEANMSGKTLTDYVIDALQRRLKESGDEK